MLVLVLEYLSTEFCGWDLTDFVTQNSEDRVQYEYPYEKGTILAPILICHDRLLILAMSCIRTPWSRAHLVSSPHVQRSRACARLVGCCPASARGAESLRIRAATGLRRPLLRPSSLRRSVTDMVTTRACAMLPGLQGFGNYG